MCARQARGSHRIDRAGRPPRAFVLSDGTILGLNARLKPLVHGLDDRLA